MEMKRQKLPHPFRPGHGAAGHFARPAIRHGCGNLTGQEIFPANRVFTNTPFNAYSPFTVKGRYFCGLDTQSSALNAGSITDRPIYN
jgi:hypothetical protein